MVQSLRQRAEYVGDDVEVHAAASAHDRSDLGANRPSGLAPRMDVTDPFDEGRHPLADSPDHDRRRSCPRNPRHRPARRSRRSDSSWPAPSPRVVSDTGASADIPELEDQARPPLATRRHSLRPAPDQRRCRRTRRSRGVGSASSMSLSQATRPGSTTSLAMKIRCTPSPTIRAAC